MSWEASTWALGLTLGNATKKLALMGYANHAHKDGTAAFPTKPTVATYAECSPRQVQRYIQDFLAEGYMCEGDQELVAHYPKGSRPVVYDLAMNEETRVEWERLSVVPGRNPLNDAAVAAGKQAAAKKAANKAGAGDSANPQVRRGDNMSPVWDDSHPEREGGDNMSPLSPHGGGDTSPAQGETNPGVGGDTAMSPKPPTNLPKTNPPIPSVAAPSSTDSAGASSKKGTRIPDDFAVTAEMVTWALANAALVDGRVETEKFIDYWRAKPGKDGVKLDWVATWRVWFRTAQQRLETSAATPRRGYDDKARWGDPDEATPVAEMTEADLDAIFGGQRKKPGQSNSDTA
jgi:hypothetical protein